VITKIHSTAVVVSDQEASLKFYTEILGWEKRTEFRMSEEYRFLTVAPPGAETELALEPGKVHGVAPGAALFPASQMGPPATGIAIAVQDVEATYQALVEKGVKFSGPLMDMPWGDKATWLLDPDDNAFFFVGS
jgi:catechol 2,3-dioxygenase-like lactoylglutathione lyase family enzyme